MLRISTLDAEAPRSPPCIDDGGLLYRFFPKLPSGYVVAEGFGVGFDPATVSEATARRRAGSCRLVVALHGRRPIFGASYGPAESCDTWTTDLLCGNLPSETPFGSLSSFAFWHSFSGPGHNGRIRHATIAEMAVALDARWTETQAAYRNHLAIGGHGHP